MCRRRKKMELHTLSAEARSATGKGVARKLRAEGRIPAVVYGHGDPASLTIDPKQLRRLRNEPLGWNTPLTLEVEGGDNIEKALLTEVQRHPVTGRFLHADFQRVGASGEVKVTVPVKTEGRAVGITLGGRVSVILPEVEVLCQVGSIPAALPVDVGPLNIGDKVLLQALPLPEGVRVASRHNPPVVSCVGKRGARKAAEEAEAEEAEE